MLITYPYRNNLSAYAAGLVDRQIREGQVGPLTVPTDGSGASTKHKSHAIQKHK